MFQPASCFNLFTHREFLSQQLGTEEVFFVGGCVRNLLLGITDNPLDIDITMGSTPNKIRSEMKTEGISRFITEKFGTITILPHKYKKLQYEITPFRTEGGYADFRHPQDITWSNDLLADSARRDFTINCLYRYGTQFPHGWEPKTGINTINDQQVLTYLQESGNVYISSAQTLILQNHSLINKLFLNGELQQSKLIDILDKATVLDGKHQKVIKGKLSIIIDPQSGIDDIIEKKLRAVGDPHKRFGEDALRIIRGPRFVNILNHQIKKHTTSELFFDFDNTTRDAMQKNYYLVSYVAKERIKTELEKVFKADDPFGFISMLDELHILGILFPAFANCKQVEQPVRYHPFDVYNHTLLTLYELQQINRNWLVRFGMLYHDVGKPEQYHFYSLHIMKDEKKLPITGQMYHTNLGVELIQRDFSQLGFSKKEIEEIARYIKWHHRPGELLDGKPENLVKKLRKMISEVGYQRVLNLIDIAIADRRGMYNPIQPPVIKGLVEMKKLVRKINKEEGRFVASQLAVNGDLLMKEFHLTPGRKVGELLNAALDWVIEDSKERNSQKKILSYLKEYNKILAKKSS